MNIKKIIIGALTGVGMLLATMSPAFAANNYFNGFETNTSGWNNYEGGTITRVHSGTNGIPASIGSYYAMVKGPDYTDWGGYQSTFPTNGYVTQIDMYLNMSSADGSDKRFDFSSAINQPDGTFRRDFIFNLGTVPGTSATNEWAISASNNAPGDPVDASSHIIINKTGWYTFRNTFENDNGVLKVVMDVLNKQGSILGTWTLSDPADIIGTTVGGNRYGWFTDERNDFSTTGIAIDNSEKYDITFPPTTFAQCQENRWKSFNNPSFKNSAFCILYVTQHMHTVTGNVTVNIAGLNRYAFFEMNSELNSGILQAYDFDRGLYHASISKVLVNGNKAWFAGRVTQSTNAFLKGKWFFAEVEDSPDMIWAEIEPDKTSAYNDVMAMNTPSGSLTITNGNITIH